MASKIKRTMACLLAVIFLIPFAPSALADDDAANATVLTDGSTSSGYVDAEGDSRDWWKIDILGGDTLTIVVSSSTGDHGFDLFGCFGTDHWEGRVKIWDSTASTNLYQSDFGSDSSRTVTVSIVPSAAEWGSVTGPTTYYTEVISLDGCADDQFDYSITGTIDKTYRDTDGDGFRDLDDDCPNDYGKSSEDKNGCLDSDEDGWSDEGDRYPVDGTQWEDSDFDNYGDNPNGNNPDSCPGFFGQSYQDRFGCPDSDGDGYSDPSTLYSIEPWTISDGADAFWWSPQDPSTQNICGMYCHTQWSDFDGDGLGDNWYDSRWEAIHIETGIGEYIEGAILEDACPHIIGYSSEDRPGCPDADGDGWSDGDSNWTIDNGADPFPNDFSQWKDTDRDGYGDNYTFEIDENGLRVEMGDAFIENPTQWSDSDGDGWGNNQGNQDTQIDAFPYEKTQYLDSDNDGYGDNYSGFEGDSCVETWGFSNQDRFGCPDSDADGFSDPDDGWISHPEGFADAFPSKASQWYDTDGDGFGDNQTQNAWQPDSCLLTKGDSYRDRWGCPDTDGDGASDPDNDWLTHPLGMADTFPLESTQWMDTDGDGYGDNPVGVTPDNCVEIPGTSTEDRYGCVDTDGDGWSDLSDKFPHIPSQMLDSDGDGYGDNLSGHEPDACPTVFGTSLLDRRGCVDLDEDGYSNPDEQWLASPEGQADAFEYDPWQWSDIDGDGYGDNPIGNLRDDCPSDSGSSTIDFQGCPDNNGDGYSNSFGEINAAITIMGRSPLSSWATYAIAGLIFLFAVIVNRIFEENNDGDLKEVDFIEQN